MVARRYREASVKINKWKCDACGKEDQSDGKPACWLELETPLKTIHLCDTCAHEYINIPPKWGDDILSILDRVIRRQTILFAVIKGSAHEG